MHTIDVQENNTTVIIEKLRGREGERIRHRRETGLDENVAYPLMEIEFYDTHTHSYIDRGERDH